jgi:hypothetical protein
MYPIECSICSNCEASYKVFRVMSYIFLRFFVPTFSNLSVELYMLLAMASGK